MIYTLDTKQIAFLIIAPLVILVILFLIIYFPVKKYRIKNKYQEIYYKKIYAIAENEDYFLINDFSFEVDKNYLLHIDHILFAEKFIYVINDHYINGNLSGNIENSSLVLTSHKGDKKYYDNPIANNKFITSRLSVITSIPTSYFIGIDIVNNDCKIEIDSQSKQFYLVEANRIKELISLIEKRDIGTLNQEVLEIAVKQISQMNRSKK